MGVDRFELALIEPRQPPGRLLHPLGQGRPVQADALTGQHVDLAVQGQMPGVLPHRDACDQGRGGHAALQQAQPGRRLDDPTLAGPAGVSWADGAQHPHPGRDHVQGFGDVLADPVQDAAAACAGRARGLQDLDHPR